MLQTRLQAQFARAFCQLLNYPAVRVPGGKPLRARVSSSPPGDVAQILGRGRAGRGITAANQRADVPFEHPQLRS